MLTTHLQLYVIITMALVTANSYHSISSGKKHWYYYFSKTEFNKTQLLKKTKQKPIESSLSFHELKLLQREEVHTHFEGCNTSQHRTALCVLLQHQSCRYQPQESCQQVGESIMLCIDLMKGNEG